MLYNTTNNVEAHPETKKEDLYMSTLLHVGIRASNLDRSIRFWRDGLGLKVAKQRGNRYDLTLGGEK